MKDKVQVCRYSAVGALEVVALVTWARDVLENHSRGSNRDALLETARTLLWEEEEYEE